MLKISIKIIWFSSVAWLGKFSGMLLMHRLKEISLDYLMLVYELPKDINNFACVFRWCLCWKGYESLKKKTFPWKISWVKFDFCLALKWHSQVIYFFPINKVFVHCFWMLLVGRGKNTFTLGRNLFSQCSINWLLHWSSGLEECLVTWLTVPIWLLKKVKSDLFIYLTLCYKFLFSLLSCCSCGSSLVDIFFMLLGKICVNNKNSNHPPHPGLVSINRKCK